MSNDVQHRLVGLLDGILTSLHSLYEDAQDGKELGPGVCLADIDAEVGYLGSRTTLPTQRDWSPTGKILVRNVPDSWFADTAETLSPEEPDQPRESLWLSRRTCC